VNLLLQRQRRTAIATLGELSVDGAHDCFTLELPAGNGGPGSCIPAGTYPVALQHSPRFNRDMPELLNVPGRSQILIHWGNYAKDTAGCILVGKTTGANEVWSSRLAFKDLCTKFLAAAGPHQITILDEEIPQTK